MKKRKTKWRSLITRLHRWVKPRSLIARLHRWGAILGGVAVLAEAINRIVGLVTGYA